MWNHNPIVFDFPCSDTFRRYEEFLNDEDSPPHCENLQEARAREDSERVEADRDEMKEERILSDKENRTKIWDRIRGLEAQNKYLLHRLSEREQKPQPKSQPKPSRGIEGI